MGGIVKLYDNSISVEKRLLGENNTFAYSIHKTVIEGNKLYILRTEG